jgi:hypothetical protein
LPALADEAADIEAVLDSHGLLDHIDLGRALIGRVVRDLAVFCFFIGLRDQPADAK